MTFVNFKQLSLTALLLGSALPAAADVTAADVWADWKDYLSSFGYSVSGTENQSGSTLTVRDLTMGMTLPEAGDFNITMSEITFTEKGDGTVAVTLPQTMPMALSMKTEAGDPMSMTVDYTHSGLSMIVSGSPADMTYTYTADTLGLALTKLESAGQPVPYRDAHVAFSGLAGQARLINENGTRHSAQTFDAAKTDWNVDFDDPKTQKPVTAKGMFEGATFTATAAIPEGLNWQDPSATMPSGFAFDTTISYQAGSNAMAFTDEQERPVKFATSSQGGDLKMRVESKALAYSGSAKNATIDLAGGDIPLPISLTMEHSGFNLMVPIAKSEEPGDFALGFDLTNFAVPELLWAMLDPTGQLPHDPATLALDVTGKAKITADFANPEAMASEGAPGELHALSVNALKLRLAGADLSGTGAFTFDNEDLESFDGMPRPEGALDLRLAGANTLLDKLVAMSLVPEDQAMGARMMMGLFGKMEGEDTLTSKIEITPEGAILANGQRLR